MNNINTLISFEEAIAITKKSEVFYVKYDTITINNEEFKFALFNYRLASYKDFKEHNAYELRGLTFIFNNTTQKWERFLALPKFFNIDENEEWLKTNFEKNKIMSIQYKEDGSFIQPIKFPNGIIKCKTKMKFDNEQAIMAENFIENNINYLDFIQYCFSINLIPLFELVSPFNQIVLQYETTELVLLQVRNLDNGLFLTFEDMQKLAKDFNISLKEKLLMELDTLMNLKNSILGIEGWVILFDNGKFAKIKTEEYFFKHGLITEDKENYLVPLILNEQIDDVLAQLNDGSEKKQFFINTINIVNDIFNHNLLIILKIFNFAQSNQMSKKEFALLTQKHTLNNYVFMPVIFKFLEQKNIEEEKVQKIIKEIIIRNCLKQEKALDFLYNEKEINKLLGEQILDILISMKEKNG